MYFFFFSSRRRHTRWTGDWSSDVCSSDLDAAHEGEAPVAAQHRGEPARVADRQRIVEAELRPEVDPHLGGDIGVGGELLEGIARRQRQDREENEADTEQHGDQDQESAYQVLRHRGQEPAEPRRSRASRPSCAYALDQYGTAQKSESQPLWTTSRIRFEIAATRGRNTTGMITTFWMTRSFSFTKSAARLTGSISASAAFQVRSYSSLRQRVGLRPDHLFSLEATSHEVNWSMKRCGSGWVIVVVYIWMSV